MNQKEYSDKWIGMVLPQTGILKRLSISETLLNEAIPERTKELIKDEESTKEKNMTNVVKFFKEMTLDADTKLLREMGLEDAMGNATETGFRLSAELLYKASRAEIVGIAKEMKAESDKDKK